MLSALLASVTFGLARENIVRQRESSAQRQLYLDARVIRDSLRTAVELCDAHDGVIIWSDRFDGRLDELFELQDRIAIRVATSVVPHLRDQELSRALRKHPDSMTAYDLTLQALDFFHRVDRASLKEAGRLLERIAHHALLCGDIEHPDFRAVLLV